MLKDLFFVPMNNFVSRAIRSFITSLRITTFTLPPIVTLSKKFNHQEYQFIQITRGVILKAIFKSNQKLKKTNLKRMGKRNQLGKSIYRKKLFKLAEERVIRKKLCELNGRKFAEEKVNENCRLGKIFTFRGPFINLTTFKITKRIKSFSRRFVR